jgi:hypothetical protein
MSRILAIGDIHGCANTFHKLIFDEIKIRKSDTIYCIGDYIDRGPDSKAVIDLILDLRKKGYQLRTLRGNHEQLMLDSAKSRQAHLTGTSMAGMSHSRTSALLLTVISNLNTRISLTAPGYTLKTVLTSSSMPD